MRKFFGIMLTVLSLQGFAQLPVIDAVEPLDNYPNLKVVITGRGFSATSAQLQVWFGQVKGTITASTEFSIEVTVPPQARLDNVEVIHLGSRLSGKSRLKYMPVYNGDGFDPTKLEPLVDNVSRFPGDRVFDLCSCDLDGDGKPDLAGTKDVNPLTDLLILKNNSTISSISFAKFDKTNLPALNLLAPSGNITCGDLNGDGKPELVATRAGSTSNSFFILPNNSTPGTLSFGAFISVNLENATDIARQISIDDLNGDGKPEIIVANSFNNTIYVFQNQSAGGVLNINTTPVKIIVAGAANTYAFEVQDFNSDGKPDIAAIQFQTNNVYFLKNQSTSSAISFGPALGLPFTGTFNDIHSADFNNDGKLDVVLTSVFNARAFVLLNSSGANISFSSAITLTTDNGPFGIDVSDINGDGHPDIIIPVRGATAINVFLHNGNNAVPGFTKVNITTTKNGWFTRTNDFDGDAKPDVAVTSFIGTTFSVDIFRNRNCHVPKILNEGPLSICPGQTIRLETIPIPGVTFTWNDGATDVSSAANPFLDITAAGNFTVKATGDGCTDEPSIAVFPVTVGSSGGNPLPPDNPVIASNAPLCTGFALNLTTNAVTGATYIWEGPNGFTSAAEDPVIASANGNHAGLYSLRVKVGDCLSKNASTLRVDVVDLASFSVGSNAPTGVICQGQSATLSVNSEPGYSYQWIKDGADIGGQTGTTLAVTAVGTYNVRVTRTTTPTCSIETSTVDVDVITAPRATNGTRRRTAG